MMSDGNLIHLGRKDFQVKIRGNRIEISEIEGLLRGLEGVNEAVVMARADGNGHQHLIAYVHSNKNAEPSVGELREAVEDGLPDYMMPSTFVILDQLPYLPNGKVDLKSLPIPDKARPHLDTPMVSPRTPIEQTLSEIWSEVLDIKDVGVDDSFHELGGHSLAASRVISRVIESFRVELPVKSLFESPTIANMALVITQNQAKRAEQADIECMLAELEAMTDDRAAEIFGESATAPQETS
jgi:acyl carrier protein